MGPVRARPGPVRHHPLLAPVAEPGHDLGQEPRLSCVVRTRVLAVKAEVPTGPPVGNDRPDHVLALDEQVSHVVHLVQEPSRVISPPGSEHVLPRRAAVYRHLVNAQRRGVQPGRDDARPQGEGSPQVRRRPHGQGYRVNGPAARRYGERVAAPPQPDPRTAVPSQARAQRRFERRRRAPWPQAARLVPYPGLPVVGPSGLERGPA